MNVVLQKVRGVLVAADEDSQRFLDALPNGQGIAFDARVRRNVRFHRKLFALLRLTFDAWEPPAAIDGMDLRKSFEAFREDMLILAGHREESWGLDGNLRLRARSISFAECDEVEFADVYSRVLDVCWDKVLRWARYSSAQEVERTVNRLVVFG